MNVIISMKQHCEILQLSDTLRMHTDLWPLTQLQSAIENYVTIFPFLFFETDHAPEVNHVIVLELKLNWIKDWI